MINGQFTQFGPFVRDLDRSAFFGEKLPTASVGLRRAASVVCSRCT